MSKRARMSSHRAGRRSDCAGRAQGALPALSSLTELPEFSKLRPSERQCIEFERERKRRALEDGIDSSEFVLACVVRLDRGFPALMSESGLFRAEFAASLTKGANDCRVAVGDWVCARRPSTHEMGILCSILPRESDVSRWRGSNRGERQCLAANVDVVFIAQALSDKEISCDRIVRSVLIARDCGAQSVVVLTKADRAGAEMLGQDIERIKAVLGSDIKIVASCAGVQSLGSDNESCTELYSAERETKSSMAQINEEELCAAAHKHGALWGSDALLKLVPAGSIGIVLGESGAGKSTLLNALLGKDALETGAVRSSDDMGRHTTVARRMVSLPGAGVIVDEPGLRSLPLVGHERGLHLVFPEISESGAQCRFRDCTHTHEPGCAVQALVEQGKMSEARLSAYRSLAAEMRTSKDMLDPDVLL